MLWVNIVDRLMDALLNLLVVLCITLRTARHLVLVDTIICTVCLAHQIWVGMALC